MILQTKGNWHLHDRRWSMCWWSQVVPGSHRLNRHNSFLSLSRILSPFVWLMNLRPRTCECAWKCLCIVFHVPVSLSWALYSWGKAQCLKSAIYRCLNICSCHQPHALSDVPYHPFVKGRISPSVLQKLQTERAGIESCNGGQLASFLWLALALFWSYPGLRPWGLLKMWPQFRELLYA